MIVVDNIQAYGWEAAIRGMRNPMNSWHLTDSIVGPTGVPHIGPNDLKLMKNLSKAGNDHGKFLRMITVTMDITAPLYWWKEFDTYKVGTVANSCSTMHKIQAKEFTLDDFSHEWLTDSSRAVLDRTIDELNLNRDRFNKTKDKLYWWQMIQLLPTSYNQKRTVEVNYQVLKAIYFARKDHKLDEWHTFCDTILSLPYFIDICVNIYDNEIKLCSNCGHYENDTCFCDIDNISKYDKNTCNKWVKRDGI